MNLTSFKSLIKERTGLSFEDARSAKLDSAIRKVMSEKGVDSPAGFFNLLVSSERDFTDLVSRLTVNETYFFREPAQLKVLAEQLVPELMKRKGAEGEIRILSAGCSTGEEPYSLVMALMESMGTGIFARCRVIAVDIDSDAVYAAKMGLYGRLSFRSLGADLRDKYFEKMGHDRYRIRDSVKKPVEFRLFSLTSHIYPESISDLDIIFYRNVSIYFDPETQRKIFKKLARLLNPGGYFVTSSTETLSHDLKVLSLIERDGVFLYTKCAGQDSEEDRPLPHPFTGKRSMWPNKMQPAAGFSQKPDTPLEKRFNSLSCCEPIIPKTHHPARTGVDAGRGNGEQERSLEDIFDLAWAMARKKEHAKALDLTDELTRRDSLFLRAYALKANILMDLEKLDEAEEVLLKSIGIDELYLDGYLLLGVIARERADYENSVKRFREALYICSSCWPALFYLAEIYHARGEFERARRQYEIILNLSDREELSDAGLTLFPAAIHVEQMIRVCRYKLTSLKSKLRN